MIEALGAAIVAIIAAFFLGTRRGKASAKQIRKNSNQPVCATIKPVSALKKVRGTAAKLVKSANCVAV